MWKSGIYLPDSVEVFINFTKKCGFFTTFLVKIVRFYYFLVKKRHFRTFIRGNSGISALLGKAAFTTFLRKKRHFTTFSQKRHLSQLRQEGNAPLL